MRKLLCLGLLLPAYISVCAQMDRATTGNSVFNTGGGSNPALGGTVAKRNPNLPDHIVGTPLFQERWAKGKIITQNNYQYTDLFLKVNLMDDRVYYLDSIGYERVVSAPLKEVILLDAENSQPAHFVNGYTFPVQKKGWYQVLVNDSLLLVRELKKKLSDHTSYNADTEFFIETSEAFIVFFDKKEYKVSKPADFKQFVPQKKDELEKYIDELDSGLSKQGKIYLTAQYCSELMKK